MSKAESKHTYTKKPRSYLKQAFKKSAPKMKEIVEKKILQMVKK